MVELWGRDLDEYDSPDRFEAVEQPCRHVGGFAWTKLADREGALRVDEVEAERPLEDED